MSNAVTLAHAVPDTRMLPFFNEPRCINAVDNFLQHQTTVNIFFFSYHHAYK